MGMTDMGFDWQIDEFMVYCRSRQLREKTMSSYEQTLRLFQRWCEESLRIQEVDKVSESVIRRYINDLQERGKYSFYADDRKKEINHPDRRRDFRKPVSVITINNYLRNMRVFFNWLEEEYVIQKNPFRKIRLLKVNRKAKEFIEDAAEARDLHVEHSDKYGWSHTSPTDALLGFVLDHDLTDILINRNELMGYRVTGTGTHSGALTTITPKPSSSRKYVCPCCGMSVRATKAVNIACLDCDEQMVLAE